MSTSTVTDVLPSYACDEWWTPAAEAKATPVYDASTGEAIGSVSAEGLDLEAMINHARTVGQKNLSELTLHERALILKQLAQYLQANREEMDRLNLTTGATARDGMIDIDGGIGTLYTFSSKGRRELPNSNVI